MPNTTKPPPFPGPGRPKGSKNRMTIARMEREYHDIAVSRLAKCFEGIHGNAKISRIRDIKNMPEEMQAAIASIKIRTENLTGGDGQQDTTVEIKLWDKLAALEKWAKHFGWVSEKVELSVTEDLLTRLDAIKARNRGKT